MYCPYCNKETPSTALFCVACKARVNKECLRCALPIRLRAQMCLHCKYLYNTSKYYEQFFDEYNPPAIIATWGHRVIKCKTCGTLHSRDTPTKTLPFDKCRMCSSKLPDLILSNPYNDGNLYDIDDFSKQQILDAKAKGIPPGPIGIIDIQPDVVKNKSPNLIGCAISLIIGLAVSSALFITERGYWPPTGIDPNIDFYSQATVLALIAWVFLWLTKKMAPKIKP